MIDVKLFDFYDSFKVVINGHAGFAPKGQDIVCAGVSALSDALVRTIEFYRSDLEEINLIIENGLLYLYIGKLKGDMLKKAEACLQMFYLGIFGIAEEYPKHVKVAYYDCSDEGILNNDTSEQTMKNE